MRKMNPLMWMPIMLAIYVVIGLLAWQTWKVWDMVKQSGIL